MANDQQKPAEGQDSEEPKYVSVDEFKKVSELTNSLGATLRKEREASAKKIGELENTVKGFAEKFAAFEQPAKPAESAPDKELEKVRAKYETEFGALKKQFEASQAQLQSEKQERAKQEERTTLMGALQSKGVTGDQLEGAMAVFEKRVQRDSTGAIGMILPRGDAQNKWEDFVPVGDALEELFKGEKYKYLLPTRAAAGAGTAPGNAARPGKRSGSPEDAKAEAKRVAKAALLRHLAGYANR
jgi:ribosomal protein L9